MLFERINCTLKINKIYENNMLNSISFEIRKFALAYEESGIYVKKYVLDQISSSNVTD